MNDASCEICGADATVTVETTPPESAPTVIDVCGQGKTLLSVPVGKPMQVDDAQ